jgi:hypothetical protein
MGFFYLIAFSHRLKIHRVYLARYIRSQGSSPLSVLVSSQLALPVKAKITCRLSPSGISPAFRSVLLSEPSPFLRLGFSSDGSGCLRPGRRCKGSFLLQSVRLMQPLVRQPQSPCPSWCFPPWGFLLPPASSSPGLGSVQDPPSGVFRPWHHRPK